MHTLYRWRWGIVGKASNGLKRRWVVAVNSVSRPEFTNDRRAIVIAQPFHHSIEDGSNKHGHERTTALVPRSR